ncbi:prolipoprotein diacylglyceryl transferase [Yoonia sediminilitoris]|uniref:Phosphatidylglycerol--prolipoprotein diacylglyceryl transferase n=1 Tax=Yoonia sediminilitoris TaxID=1286148 RepID=A0A2T6KQC5_9RHOB|nr:prolipoprotein diacylglyceryl transferase [Yoonia sediminilitoris]PUB18759.1 prolipoprotein diacylglyceryl transferase [Yoonia sediminilitoris]RCW98927.1 prolipoprotein diacylglyceryl transferase [Yoonia sediminilitoris]
MNAALPFPAISPDIFSFTIAGFTIALKWYAMAYIVGIAIGWVVIKMALKRPALWRGDPPMAPSKLEDLLTYIVVGVIGGGRLGYVLLYKPADFLAAPLDIIKIWEGGLSFHGGFIGVVVAVYLFSRRHQVPLPDLADIIAVAATPAILLVRCANFINAELWGRPTDLPWGVIFPGADAQSCATATAPCVRHPSQLYEAGLEGLLLGTVLMLMAFRFGALRTPWLLTGTFFTGYGISRFLVEFVRQPDAHFQTANNPLGLRFHIDGIGLTMGQSLSLPMILVGITVILLARRRQ